MTRLRRGLVAASTALFATGYLACVGDAPLSDVHRGDGGDDSGATIRAEAGGGDGGDSGSAAPDDGGSGEGSLAPDAAPALGCPLGCLPPAPGGWTGPSATYDGPAASKPATCPALYTQLEVNAHQGIDAGPAVCGCGSPAFRDAKCSANVEVWPSAGCATGTPLLEGVAAAPGGCVTVSNGSGFLKVTTPALTLGTCAYPTPPAPTLPAPTFQAVNVSCGLPQMGACNMHPSCAEVPVPDAPFSRVCIHKAGDLQCPSADYAKRFVAYRTVVEGRSCEPCSGATANGACGMTWGLSGTMVQCSVQAPPTTNAANACVTNPGIGALVNAGAMAPSGITCAQDGGTPKGSPTSTDPVTFCCNK